MSINNREEGADEALRAIQDALKDMRPVAALNVLAAAAGPVTLRVPRPMRGRLLKLFHTMIHVSVTSAASTEQTPPCPGHPWRLDAWTRR